MGLLDSLANEALSALSGQQPASGSADAAAVATAHPGMMEVITGLLVSQGSGTGADGNASGGLPGLLAMFERSGLGDVVGSWISTGHNLPISADQLQSVLGSEQIQAIAQKLGLPPDAAAQALAHVLPQAVNHVTPDGEVPSSVLLEQGLALFRSMSVGR